MLLGCSQTKVCATHGTVQRPARSRLVGEMRLSRRRIRELAVLLRGDVRLDGTAEFYDQTLPGCCKNVQVRKPAVKVRLWICVCHDVLGENGPEARRKDVQSIQRETRKIQRRIQGCDHRGGLDWVKNTRTHSFIG